VEKTPLKKREKFSTDAVENCVENYSQSSKIFHRRLGREKERRRLAKPSFSTFSTATTTISTTYTVFIFFPLAYGEKNNRINRSHRAERKTV
jgi:hypothetical protein